MRHYSLVTNPSVVYALVPRSDFLSLAVGTKVPTIKDEATEQFIELIGPVDGKHHQSEVDGSVLGYVLDTGLLRRLCLQ